MRFFVGCARKFFIAAALCVLAVSVALAQNLREYVCIVEQVISDEMKEMSKKLGEEVRTRNSKYGEALEEFAESKYAGSGFVYYVSGKPYIVTNRHVLANAATATVKFENEDGSMSEYKDLKIVRKFEDIDLALVALPSTFKKPGLSFAKAAVSDGADVFTAGFPGWGKEQSWRLGKGIVSNSRFKDANVMDPEVSTLVQHTAQQDGGNSGGPLLIADKSAKAGYSVAGVNTWTMLGLTDAHLSIPAAIVEKSIVDCINGKLKEKSATQQNDDLAKMFREETIYYRETRAISDEILKERGVDDFVWVLQRGSSSMRSAVDSFFKGGAPLDGMRFAVLLRLYNSFCADGKVVDFGVEKAANNGSAECFECTFADKKLPKITILWKKEDSSMKISGYSIEGEKKDAKKDKKKTAKKGSSSEFEFYDGYYLLISGGLIKRFDMSKTGWAFNFEAIWNYVGLGLGVATIPAEGFEKEAPVAATVRLRVQLPLKFGRFRLNPYFMATPGLFFSEPKKAPVSYDFFGFPIEDDELDSPWGFSIGVGGGLDAVFELNDDAALFLGAEFLRNTLRNDVKDKGNCVTFHFGIKCIEI